MGKMNFGDLTKDPKELQKQKEEEAGILEKTTNAIKEKSLERKEEKYKKALENKQLEENDAFSSVRREVKDAVDGGVGLTVVANSVATLVGPFAGIFVFDLDEKQLQFMWVVLTANLIANILATFIHIWNNKKTALAVGKGVFYTMDKEVAIQRQKMEYEDKNFSKEDKDELDEFRLQKRVNEELKKRGV
jgi:hypothetical protein